MQRIYLVIASTGEDSDHTESVVTAYLEKAHAEIHIERAREAARGIIDREMASSTYLDEKNPWDDQMTALSGELYYRVQEETLYFHIDEYIEERTRQ
jgi:hypothetical protein